MKLGGRKDGVEKLARPQGVILKSDREIELMRAAGRLVYRVLGRVEALAVPGVSTGELNAEAERMIREAGATPLFKGVTNPQAKFPFPGVLCTSVNEELVHGIPGNRRLADGDVLSVDCGVRLAGYCGDSARTMPIGRVSDEAKHLLEVTEGALNLAIREVRPGRRWSAVAEAMQAYVETEGLHVVRDFVGHGIGRDMHEEPKVPNYWSRRQGVADFELVPRMVLAVEPMVNVGTHRVMYGDDAGWVVVTRDHSFAAHYEHTIAVTATGSDVLTDGR